MTLVAAHRRHRKTTIPEKASACWADVVVDFACIHHTTIIAGDFNAERDLWLGELAEKVPEAERSSPAI